MHVSMHEQSKNHIGGCHVLMLAIVPSHVMLNGCSYMYMCSLLASLTLANSHIVKYGCLDLSNTFRDASVSS